MGKRGERTGPTTNNGTGVWIFSTLPETHFESTPKGLCYLMEAFQQLCTSLKAWRNHPFTSAQRLGTAPLFTKAWKAHMFIMVQKGFKGHWPTKQTNICILTVLPLIAAWGVGERKAAIKQSSLDGDIMSCSPFKRMTCQSDYIKIYSCMVTMEIHLDVWLEPQPGATHRSFIWFDMTMPQPSHCSTIIWLLLCNAIRVLLTIVAGNIDYD
jgi:hypothetical protein